MVSEKCFMYGIYIYLPFTITNQPNVGIYIHIIHGSYGYTYTYNYNIYVNSTCLYPPELCRIYRTVMSQPTTKLDSPTWEVIDIPPPNIASRLMPVAYHGHGDGTGCVLDWIQVRQRKAREATAKCFR